MLTAYDFPSARLVTRRAIDLILVGDSLGHGGPGLRQHAAGDDGRHGASHQSYPSRCARGVRHRDLPFLSYGTPEQALANAARLMKEAGADSVKLEGGVEIVPIIEAAGARRRTGSGPCRPHSADRVGARGYKLQGKDEENARRIMEGAQALERAGCWGVVLELVPSPLARLVTERIAIPTIGIGAGAHCDGQVLVFTTWWACSPAYAELRQALREPARRSRTPSPATPPTCATAAFPAEGQSFGMKERGAEARQGVQIEFGP